MLERQRGTRSGRTLKLVKVLGSGEALYRREIRNELCLLSLRGWPGGWAKGRDGSQRPVSGTWRPHPPLLRWMSEIPDLISEGTKRSGECRNLGPVYPLMHGVGPSGPENNLFSLREGGNSDVSCGLTQPRGRHSFIWLAQAVDNRDNGQEVI